MGNKDSADTIVISYIRFKLSKRLALLLVTYETGFDYRLAVMQCITAILVPIQINCPNSRAFCAHSTINR